MRADSQCKSVRLVLLVDLEDHACHVAMQVQVKKV